MKLYSLKEENGRWKIVAPNGKLYTRYAPFFGKGQAERTVAHLNQPILLARIKELEAQLDESEGVSKMNRVEIFINGTMAVATEGESLSYDDILKLHYEKPVSGHFTIQYTRAGGDKPSGTLLRGQSVIVKRGMVIDAVQTNGA